MLSISALASALLLVPGALAQQDCSSIYNAIQSHNQQMANANPSQSISTFTALLAALGFSESLVNQLGSSTVLIPNDQAFATFVEEAGGNADPVSYIMTRPDVFKQILLFHFGGPLVGNAGELHTAIEAVAMEQLPAVLQGWIDTTAICGREDSKYVHIKYSADADDLALKFTEPISQHFTSNEVDRPCESDSVSVVIVDRVLTPCPLSLMFSGCMTVAAAAAEIPGHPLGAAPYEVDNDASIVSLLKHPNLLTSGSGSAYTVFVPLATALVEAGVTSPEFMANAGALDHVVSGHVIETELCVGSGAPANGEFVTKLDGVDQFCGAGGAVTVTTGGQGAVTVTAASGAAAAVEDTKNIAVCGGVVHIVNDVLLPCELAEYTRVATSPVDASTPDENETPRESPETASGGGDVESVADSAVGVATGVAAAAVALAAALVM